MTMAEAYTPNLSLLSKSGVSLTSFQPEAEVRDSLLCRFVLECGSIAEPISYYAANRLGLGLLHLKSGSLLLTDLSSNRSVSLSERDFYLFDCRLARQIMVPGRAEYELLLFDGPGRDYFCRQLPEGMPLWQIPSAAPWSGELLPLFEKKEVNPILCHMLLTKMLSRLALEHILPPRTAPAYLEDIKSRLETHYYERYGLVDLEKKYKVNRYRLCREFKSHYQTSPLQYLHRMRIQAARSLLAETNLKVHEISYEVGYENVNHFIAHFKKIMGATPTEYRLSVYGKSDFGLDNPTAFHYDVKEEK